MSKSKHIIITFLFALIFVAISVPVSASSETSALKSSGYAFELLNENGIVIDTKGVPIASGGDSSLFMSSDNFISVANSAPNGATLKLNTDIHLTDKSQMISLKEGYTLNLDLNGNTLSHVMKLGDNYRGTLFTPANYSSLNIYSSKVGVELISAAARNNGALSNRPLINAYVYGFTLSLGAYENAALGINADGDNLTVVASTVIDLTSSSSIGSKITINGGTYVKLGTYTGAPALFTLRSTIDFNATDALFYSVADEPIFSDEAQAYAKLNAVIEDSVIMQTAGKSYAFVNKLASASSVTVKNTDIIAPLPTAHKGTVTFGPGTRLCTAFDRSLYSYTEPVTLIAKERSGISVSANYREITVDTTAKTVTVGNSAVIHALSYSLSHEIVNSKTLLTTNTKANLNTKSGFYFNFYLPTDITDNASVFGDADYSVYITADKKIIDGIDYSVYEISVSPDDVGSVSIYLKLPTLNGEIIQKEYKLSLAEYFNAVLNISNVTDAERKLIINAANYSNSVYRYINGVDADAYSTILTEENLKLTAIDNEKLMKDAERGNINTLYSYINGITVYIGEKNISRLAFYSTSALPLDITLNSADSGSPISYSATKSGNYYLASGDYGIYDIISNMTLRIGDASGTCNLAMYIRDASDDDKAKAVAKAIYAYATASYEYITEAD